MVASRGGVRAAGAALIAVWVLVAAEPGRAPGAGPAADDARLLLPGLIVDERDLPVDAGGRAALDAVPGARARRPMDAALQQRLQELDSERDRVGVRSAAGAVREALPVLSGDSDAPARLDAGDPDPERLNRAVAPRTAR